VANILITIEPASLLGSLTAQGHSVVDIQAINEPEFVRGMGQCCTFPQHITDIIQIVFCYEFVHVEQSLALIQSGDAIVIFLSGRLIS
ncbi:hypothetical protein ACPL2J_23240, partial [Escherichia coli]|uniref:hypothetical protein n=1 Tax=Escherichia coli TaxID=562 RepID=UPI003C76D1FD